MDFVRNCGLGLAWGSAALALVPLAILAVLSSNGYDLTGLQVFWAGLTFVFFCSIAVKLANEFDGLGWWDKVDYASTELAAWLLQKLSRFLR